MARNERVKENGRWFSLCSYGECQEHRAHAREVYGCKSYGELMFCYEHAKAFDAGTLYPRSEKPDLRIFKPEIPFVLAPFQERK